VYLPPGYAAKPQKRFPVLYAHDGQNMFDTATSYAGEWGADESAETLALRGLEAIIVAIPNMGTERMAEYAPFPGAESRMIARGQLHAAFVKYTLKPMIDGRYRTLPDRVHTGLIGSSMGGLLSLYTGMLYPETFGFVGAMSPSVWFGGWAVTDWLREHRNPGVRVWVDMGSEEGDGMLLGAQWVADLLKAQGNDVKLVIAAGARHDEAAWRVRFPQVLEWFLTPQHPNGTASVTGRAKTLLEKAVSAHGGAAFAAMQTLKIQFETITYGYGPNGLVAGMPVIQTAFFDFEAGRLRLEQVTQGKLVMVQQIGPQGAFLFTLDAGTRPVMNGMLDGLWAYLVSGPFGLRLGVLGRDSAMFDGSKRLLDRSGESVCVVTRGLATEYLFASDGTLIAEWSRAPAGVPITILYDDYRNVNGIRFPFTFRNFQDGTLVSSFKMLEVQVNLSFNPDTFKMP
jgi:predicted alpha/beta superfamily hydrolase